MAILDATKLSIYNGALLRLGSRKLASLTENRKPRRILDDIWGDGALVRYALERGEWNFAIRSIEAVYDSGLEPLFGFTRAFPKPEDVCRLASLCSDPSFNMPLTNEQYIDEAGIWFANHDVLYIRYVSDAEVYGFNDQGWSEAFKEYLECRAAWLSCEAITNSTAMKDRLMRDMEIALRSAKSRDAMDEGVKFAPYGSWVQSRNRGRREW